MRFAERKRRQPPAIIIVSLIDILIVLLIFLMVTTTFRSFPSVRVNLPSTRESQAGATEKETLIITLPHDKDSAECYLGKTPVALDQLQAELNARAAKNKDAIVSIRCDTEVPMGRWWQVTRMIQKAGFREQPRVWEQSGVKP